MREGGERERGRMREVERERERGDYVSCFSQITVKNIHVCYEDSVSTECDHSVRYLEL